MMSFEGGGTSPDGPTGDTLPLDLGHGVTAPSECVAGDSSVLAGGGVWNRSED